MIGEPKSYGYQFIDFDNHYYETHDCFTRHMEARFADQAINTRVQANGTPLMYQGDQPMRFIPAHPSSFIQPPGTRIDYFAGRPSDVMAIPRLLPEEMPQAFDRDVRIKVMDDLNTQAAIMLPTLGGLWEFETRPKGQDVVLAHIRAFNRWVEDDWGYHYRDRIYSAALISLVDLDQAIAELERIIALGCRAFWIIPAPVDGKSPADPYFDPFWARANEAKLILAMHGAPTGFDNAMRWGEKDGSIRGLTPFQWYSSHMYRPIMDTIAALVMHNLFARFPNIKMVVIENGCFWVPFLVKFLDKAAHFGGYAEGPGGILAEPPSEIIKRHVFFTTFFEDDVGEVMDALTPCNVLLGSDYPHAEGPEHPSAFYDRLMGIGVANERKFMRDNGADLLGLAR